MTLTLTIEQRMNLTLLLRVSGRGKLTGDNRVLSRRILTLIRIPKDELRKYEQPGPNGAWRDQEKIDGALSVNVEIEDTLADKLLRMIKEFENWGPEDDDWLDPLLVQLEPAERRL